MSCFWIDTSLGWKTFSSHAHQTGLWYLLGNFFKIFSEYPCPFYMRVFPGGWHYWLAESNMRPWLAKPTIWYISKPKLVEWFSRSVWSVSEKKMIREPTGFMHFKYNTSDRLLIIISLRFLLRDSWWGHSLSQLWNWEWRQQKISDK